MRIIVPCKKRERDYTRHPSILGAIYRRYGNAGFTGVAIINMLSVRLFFS